MPIPREPHTNGPHGEHAGEHPDNFRAPSLPDARPLPGEGPQVAAPQPEVHPEPQYAQPAQRLATPRGQGRPRYAADTTGEVTLGHETGEIPTFHPGDPEHQQRQQAAARASMHQRPSHPNSVIEFRGVTKRYDSSHAGVQDVSFTVHRGEFLFLIGQTGAGKSTLMKLLLKEMDQDSGTVRVGGKDLSEITRKNVPYYRRNLGVVFQDFKLLPNRTVYDNVAYALQVTGASRKKIRSQVPDVLRLTGLSTKLHNYPHQLSGGEQQRVSVARAFVNHPPLLLADEPTGNLDPETTIGIMQLLYRINKTGSTVVVCTHDENMVNRMRRRVIELDRGRLIRDEVAGGYGRPESTAEFGALLRDEPAPVPQRLRDRQPSYDLFDDAFAD